MGAEMKTVGYIILIEAKATQDKTSETMSYGHTNETDSEMLLRRGRATLFESYEETEQALKETLLAATAQNSKWPEKFIYKIVPVEVTAPHPKPEQEPDDLTIAYMSGFHDGKNKEAPQRKPLTDEEFSNLVVEHLGPHALTGGKMSVYDAFLIAVRATEAAHGIKGE
jgi:hypothetical protein